MKERKLFYLDTEIKCSLPVPVGYSAMSIIYVIKCF